MAQRNLNDSQIAYRKLNDSETELGNSSDTTGVPVDQNARDERNDWNGLEETDALHEPLIDSVSPRQRPEQVQIIFQPLTLMDAGGRRRATASCAAWFRQHRIGVLVVSALLITGACLAGIACTVHRKGLKECSSSPCVNGGTCVERKNGFACGCAPGFTGQRCETASTADECRQSCIAVYSPVCGTDGQTYSNECQLKFTNSLKRTNVAVAHAGVCVNASAADECRQSCIAAYSPVCGTDGQTYSNECRLQSTNCLKRTNVAVAHAGACAYGSLFWRLKKKHEFERRLRHSQFSKSAPAVKVIDKIIIQPLDHFDALNTATFPQRYYVVKDFWNRPYGPVFLYIGGEAELDDDEFIDGEIAVNARKYGALIVAAEHRFYGKSINPDGLMLENLRFLSSQQALADLATLHGHILASYNLTARNKWISFGGSYPGALAAWIRIKYPHLIHGAVASSAVVKAVLDNKGYNDIVAKSLADPIVGGSSKCAQSVREAFKIIDEMMAAENWSQLSCDFHTCKPLTDGMDAFILMDSAAELFMVDVQYNGLSKRGIALDCEIMIDTSDVYQNLVYLWRSSLEDLRQHEDPKYMNNASNCFDASWEDRLLNFKNTEDISGYRQWVYQMCAQFGFFQACDDEACLFSRRMTLEPNLLICESVYNISAQRVSDQIAFTNEYYGADQPAGSNIVFVNGDIDPWHALSVLKDLSQSQQAILIRGTSHCANMIPDNPSDLPQLRAARKQITQLIGGWLSDKSKDKSSRRSAD